MKDAVGKERMSEDRPIYVPEFLVIFEHLERIALEYDLKLVEKKNFHEFYDENIAFKEQSDLFDRMVMKDSYPN